MSINVASQYWKIISISNPDWFMQAFCSNLHWRDNSLGRFCWFNYIVDSYMSIVGHPQSDKWETFDFLRRKQFSYCRFGGRTQTFFGLPCTICYKAEFFSLSDRNVLSTVALTHARKVKTKWHCCKLVCVHCYVAIKLIIGCGCMEISLSWLYM